MKEISKLASLSRIYTNHSVRATAITLWSDAQVPSRHIMAISDHRSEASLKSYNTRPSSEQLRAYSDIFSGVMSGGPRQPNSPNAVTSSGNPLAVVNSTVVHSQNNTARQFVKYQPQVLSSLFSNCQVNNIQVFMGHDSAGFHWSCYSRCWFWTWKLHSVRIRIHCKSSSFRFEILCDRFWWLDILTALVLFNQSD